MSAEILVVFEHDRGKASDTSYQAFGMARALIAAGVGSTITAVLVGADADSFAPEVGAYGASQALRVHHHELTDYAPQAWGDIVAELVATRSPAALVAIATDRGSEVLAHVAAIVDIPFAANVLSFDGVSDGALLLTRVRWGGSLLEQASLRSNVLVISGAPHVFSPDPVGNDVAQVNDVEATLDGTASRTRIVDRVTLAAGITLTTAAVVVSGGRGVGSADGFAPLVELADLLGGAVGCSRVVTNNGWRPHSDQVGQTGKRIAPELYIACGISGAIQHWVGMMASKHVLAINTDKEANMVGKAEYAVVGDLHQILPAVSEEIRRRRANR